MKIFKIVSVFLLVSCQGATHALRADVEPAAEPAPAPVVVGVTQARYSGLRVGDIAPQFALPKSDGTLWNSYDQLGQRAVLLVFIGKSPVLVAPGVTPQSVVADIAQTARALRESGVETVVVSGAEGIDLSGIDPQFDLLNLKDGKEELSNLFSPSPTELTLVAIDKAGFLRHIETAAQPQIVGEQMQRIGDLTPKLEVGKPAPDFSISDMNGRVRRLSDLRGRKNLLLAFFPKCFTGGCANQLTSLQDERVAFKNSDTEIWAVSVDPAEGEKGQIRFAASLGLSFPLLPDTGRNLSLLYDAARKPHNSAWRRTMLIDKDGILRFVDRQIHIYTHGPDMLAKMRELDMIK
jgi:thioredoxin-dependent peroxiredoxin